MRSILVIEDEILLGRQIGRALEGVGDQVRLATTGHEGLALVGEETPDLVFLDLRLPDRSGLEILRDIRRLDPSIPVVLMTAYGSVSDAVEAMRLGASDYLQKPLDLDELRMLVDRVLARQRRDRELAYHRERGRSATDGIVGEDTALTEIFSHAERLGQARLEPAKRPTILLTGETGTGKSVIAAAIHEILGGGPFIEASCTAMPQSLVEAELFGHESGAFTDARIARPGLFEAADGGTLFLDEVGHASPELQAKLLGVIEDKRFRRLGSVRERAVNVHVIAATNRDLDAAVESGEFREDLLHRLRVLSFEVPPLRARAADIRMIANHFCREIGQLYGRRVTLDEEGGRVLASYAWPGNVRELRNVIERAILLGGGDELGASAFADLLRAPGVERSVPFALPPGGVNLAELERDLLRQALERTGGNRTRAAALLGLTRDTLRYRIEKFGLD